MEVERLTSVKFKDYSSVKSDSVHSYSEKPTDRADLQSKYMELLQPTERVERTERDASRRHPAACPSRNATDALDKVLRLSENTERDRERVKPRSLIVELMPHLPLQLCEKELARIDKSQQKIGLANSKNEQDLFSDRIILRSDLPDIFSQIRNNSDAG